MTNEQEIRLRETSFDQIWVEDTRNLIKCLDRNRETAAKQWDEVMAASPPTLAALFNNLAYTGGGIYWEDSTRQAWVNYIKQQVSNQQWDVVWGPVWHYPNNDHFLYESDACMFVAKDRSSNNLMVVVRGTNFASMGSWLDQDFDTGVMVPLTNLIPTAPNAATVARGTHTGLQILMSLRDSGKTVAEFLKLIPPSRQYVFLTGHSLGGTLTPPYFLYLNYVLNGDVNGAKMIILPISFAGLTPGGPRFNTYFAQQLNGVFFYRFVNTLDIAPYCWWSEQGVLTIYDNKYNVCGPIYGGKPTPVIKDLFSGISGWYQEISTKYTLTGSCPYQFDLWETLALYQHHVSTYLSLMTATVHKMEDWKKEPAKKAAPKKKKLA